MKLTETQNPFVYYLDDVLKEKFMTNQGLQSTMAATPIQDVVDTFFAFLEAKLPQYAGLLKGANGLIDWILQKEGL